MNNVRAKLLSACEDSINGLQSEFPEPKLVKVRAGNAFRYEKQNDLLMSYLKCISALSAANAANVVFELGYIAEVTALSRICNECHEDVIFPASALGEDSKPSKHQKQHIQEYFLEEFAIDGSLPEAQAVRHRVPRSKINLQ